MWAPGSPAGTLPQATQLVCDRGLALGGELSGLPVNTRLSPRVAGAGVTSREGPSPLGFMVETLVPEEAAAEEPVTCLCFIFAQGRLSSPTVGPVAGILGQFPWVSLPSRTVTPAGPHTGLPSAAPEAVLCPRAGGSPRVLGAPPC